MQHIPVWPTVSRGARRIGATACKACGRGCSSRLLVIFAMLAVPLNSYIQPVIIMAAIPFGIVGAVIGHLIMGYSLSVSSMFGVVALHGVVVNDSLVLIDLCQSQAPGRAPCLRSRPEVPRSGSGPSF